MSMQHIGFQTLATRYAHLATRDGKPLRVTFSGAQAYTEPGHINLPAFESGTVLTSYQYLIYCGYLDHEIGHQRFTDFNLFGAEEEHSLLKVLTNALEDPREERLQIAVYPGSKKYLDALCHHCDAITVDSLKKEGKGISPLWLIYKEAYILLRDIDTGKIPGRLADDTRLLPIANLMRTDLPKCTSTLEVKLLAEKIQELLPNAGKPESEPKSQFLELSERRNLLQALISNIKQHNNPGQRPNPKQRPDPNLISLPADTTGDQIFIPGREDLTQYNLTRNEVSAEVQALKKMLRIYLSSRARRAWTRGLEQGQLDHDQLAPLAAGISTRVFKDLRERSMINTAVELMIDLSTSMNSQLVRQAAICIAESVGTIPKIKLSVSGFNAFAPVRILRRGDEPEVGRISPMTIKIFKDYDEQYISARGKLGAISTGGVTPLGDAYGKALEHILTRTESRRIIWLITDGLPEFAVGDLRHSDLILMRNIKARAKRLGIETLALGIGERSIQPYVDRFFFINSIAELPAELMKILKEVNS